MKSSPAVRQPRHPNFPLEFKLNMVERSYQPGISVAQLARENGINDNLLFKWRQFWREGKLRPPDERQPLQSALVPVVIDDAVSSRELQPDSEERNLSCKVIFRHGTLRLNGSVSDVLLKMLIQELKQ
ncbi:transposase [Klebsiella sp. 141196]|uniref:IS66-like element accessory protein TnpA n=1 Tax=unclassified Klebsiella TaxID=2608929 RepID=UPI003D34FA0B